MQLVSNLTSFGVGFSIKGPDGSWQQVPITYPLRTGLYAVSRVVRVRRLVRDVRARVRACVNACVCACV